VAVGEAPTDGAAVEAAPAKKPRARKAAAAASNGTEAAAEEAAPAKKPRAKKAAAASSNGTEAAAAASSNGTAPDDVVEPAAEPEKKTRTRKTATKEVAK